MGFKTLGLLDKPRAHPEIVEVLKPLEVKDMSTLFEVDSSAPGSKSRHLFLERNALVIVLRLCRRMQSLDTRNGPPTASCHCIPP